MTDRDDRRIALLLALGRGLHEAGFSAPQLESALQRVAAHVGIEAQFFSTPTSMFSAFGSGATQHVHLFRVEPASVDLGRLVDLEALVDELVAGAIDLDAALLRTEAITAAKPPFPVGVTLAAHAASSAAFAVFLGGSWHEIATASGLGLIVGVLAALAGRVTALGRVFELVAATVAAFAAVAAARVLAPMSVFTATLAGLIVLLPGFTLTIALTELATRHLAAGTARLAGALVTFLTLGFGVALGSRLGELAFGIVEPGAPADTHAVSELLAVVVAAVSLSLILRAPVRELHWLVAAGFIGFFGSRYGARWLSPQLGMFVGALALGVTSNLYAWLRKRPGTTVLVPGVLLLVPGSIGYRSLSELMSREVVPGIETAVEMVLVAVSLVAGLLAANVLTPPRGTVIAGRQAPAASESMRARGDDRRA